MISGVRRATLQRISPRTLSRLVTVTETFLQPTPHSKFHVDFPKRILTAPKLTAQKYDEEKLHFVVVKAPPGASESSKPGKIEWTKTVGARVKARELVCIIRFRDGRSLGVAAPVQGIIAARLKKENDPIMHGDELFKIRLDPVEKILLFKKKKLMKKDSTEFDDEEDVAQFGDTERKAANVNISAETDKDTTSTRNVKDGHTAAGEEKDQGSEKSKSMSWNQSGLGAQDGGSYLNRDKTFARTALMTTMEEINMESTLKFLENYDNSYYLHKPSIKSLYVKAAAFVLKMKPTLNITIHNEEKVQKTDIDITVGVRHLQVLAFHTFKMVDKTSYLDIGRVLREVKKQVAEGTFRQPKQTMDFTIGQEWEIGSVFGTPQYSKTCTLGLHKSIKRPTLIENQIVANPMMYVSLTYNSVLINDKDAVDFLKMYKLAIEEPRYILVNAE